MARRDQTDEQKFNQLKEAARNARFPYEADWWVNVAFYLSHQYVEWSDTSRSVREIPRREGQEMAPRPVVNKISHFIQQQHAFVLSQEPCPEAIPSNDDVHSQSDASVALAYARYSAEKSDYSEVEETAQHWALVAGTSFKKWTWDPLRKRPVVDALTPFDLFLDPYATQWKDVRWIIHERFMDPEQVFDQWGVELKAAPQEADQTKTQYLRGMGLAPVQNGVTVNEIWIKPSRRHPRGLFAVWAGDESIVAAQDLPYDELVEEHLLPFTIQGVIPRPGTPYYDGHPKLLRPIQMELNKVHAQHLMTGDNFANLKWWLPDEANLEAPPTNHPFQILKGSGAVAKPEIIQPPNMPALDDEWMRQEMSDVVGLHETSSGGVEGRLESAKAIELIREPDAQRLAVLLKTTERSLETGFYLFVSYGRQFESEEKVITAYSEDGVMEVKKFRSGEQDKGLRFKVTMGSGLGYSRQGRAEMLYNLWDRGILQDDPVRFLNLLDVSGNLPLSSQAKDQRLARNENLEMADGIAVKANSWDAHDIHMREHNDYRKSMAFRLLSPRAQSVFEFHVNMHKVLMATSLQETSAFNAIASGAMAGPPAGPPSPDGAAPPGEEAPPEEGGPPPEGGSAGPPPPEPAT